MARRKSIFKKGFNTNLGWILLLLLVAGSSFLLGSSVNRKPQNQNATEAQTAQTQSVIGDISASLQNPAPTPTNPTTPLPTVSAVVSINTGSLSELDALPGIGPAYAQAIINYRTTNGPFIRIEDIQKVKGIGPKTFEKLKDKITI